MRNEGGGSAGLYKVPKANVLTLIKIPPSPPSWKTISLFAQAENHHGQETISDVFKASRTFLPLHGHQGEVIIVRRDAIRWIRVENPEEVEWHYYEVRQGAPSSTARFAFSDGEVLEGRVYATGPSGEQRLLDAVNKEERFLHLDTSSGLFLINLKMVSSITVTEEKDGRP